MSDSPQKAYRRYRVRWILSSIVVTLSTGTLGLLRDHGHVPPTIFSLALGTMIVCWLVAALAWCTHSVIEEQRRREARTVTRVARLLTEHNVAGWAAYAEKTENVYPINGRK